MTHQLFESLIFKILSDLQKTFENRSDDLIHSMTLSQYKMLAAYDVEEKMRTISKLETLLTEYRSFLENEKMLKKQQFDFMEKLTDVQDSVNAYSSKFQEVNKMIKNNDFGFLGAGVSEIKNVSDDGPFATEDEKLEEPVYSTRQNRTLQQKITNFDVNSLQKPLYSAKHNRSNKKNAVSKKINFDESVFDGGYDIEMENVPRKLKFDDLDDDEDEDDLKPQTSNSTKFPELKTNPDPAQSATLQHLFELPPPPVFTSSFRNKLSKN